jgi:hypothetical protein
VICKTQKHDVNPIWTNEDYDKPPHKRANYIQTMAKFLQLALWNAYGLSQYMEKLTILISIQNIDVMLNSGTYFPEKSSLTFSNYTIYHQIIHPEFFGTVFL